MGFEPPRFIYHLNVFRLDQNCSKDPNLQAATPDSESMLTNYVKIGPSHQQFTVYIFRIYRPVWGFEPQA